jgi:hypothetical protein
VAQRVNNMHEDLYYTASSHFSDDKALNLLPETIGQKAIGLFDMPKDFTPPFIVLNSSLFESWINSPDGIDNLLKAVIDKCLLLFEKENIKLFIVRSSAEVETFNERGYYKSSKGNIDKDSLLNCIKDVFLKNKEYVTSNKDSTFSLIIQQYIKPALFGHLSNERRISEHNQYWLYEIETQAENIANIRFLARDEIQEIPSLDCKNITSIRKKFREIASYWQTWKYEALKRYHLERVGKLSLAKQSNPL